MTGRTHFVRCQYFLYCLRLLLLCGELFAFLKFMHLPITLVQLQYTHNPRWLMLSTCLIVFLVANDFVMLTWDVYFYGCFLTSVIVQVFISFSVVIFGIWWIVVTQNLYSMSSFAGLLYLYHTFDHLEFALSIWCSILAVLFSTLLIIASTRAWIRGPKGAWKLGVKDLACTDSSFWKHRSPLIALFGKRRKPDDEVRARTWTGLEVAFIRRIPELDTLKFALCRNITALVLLLILTAQSIRLISGVINETLSVRDTWDNLQIDVSATWPTLYLVPRGGNDVPLPHLTTYISSQDLNSSLSDLLQMPACKDFICVANMTTNEFISIAVVFGPGTLLDSTWLALDNDGLGYAPSYLVPMKLVPGSHIHGFMEIVEYRKIVRSFWNMMGFTTTYAPSAMVSIRSAGQVPSENNSVAQATLQWERNITPNPFNTKYPIIEEYRQHTFLDALSSIGGLLAILQGLHVLVFGRPLWWGLFGSKAVNPFGLFRVSPSIREQMIARYGHIPSPTTEGDSATHKLGLFLSDFILDMGPLYKDNEEMEQEEGNLHPEEERYAPGTHHLDPSFRLLRRSDESAGVDNDMEMMHVLLERNTTERNVLQ